MGTVCMQFTYTGKSDLVPVPGFDKQLQLIHRQGCHTLVHPLQLLEQVLQIICTYKIAYIQDSYK